MQNISRKSHPLWVVLSDAAVELGGERLNKSIFKVWMWVRHIQLGFLCCKSQPKSRFLVLPQWLAVMCWSPSRLRFFSFSRALLCVLILITHHLLPHPISGRLIPLCTHDHLLIPGGADCHRCLPLYLFSCLCIWHWKAQTRTVNIWVYAFVCLLERTFPEENKITEVQECL